VGGKRNDEFLTSQWEQRIGQEATAMSARARNCWKGMVGSLAVFWPLGIVLNFAVPGDLGSNLFIYALIVGFLGNQISLWSAVRRAHIARRMARAHVGTGKARWMPVPYRGMQYEHPEMFDRWLETVGR
jgi:predicted lipid-binding transport protein (Tim44 family)